MSDSRSPQTKELGWKESSGSVCFCSPAGQAHVHMYMYEHTCTHVLTRACAHEHTCTQARVCVVCGEQCGGVLTRVLVHACACVHEHVHASTRVCSVPRALWGCSHTCVHCVFVCVCLCTERGARRSPGLLAEPGPAPARNQSLPLPVGWSPWGKLLDIWAKQSRNEITTRFAACYLFVLKINDTIERFHSILLKQYPLHGSQEGERAPGPEGGSWWGGGAGGRPPAL